MWTALQSRRVTWHPALASSGAAPWNYGRGKEKSTSSKGFLGRAETSGGRMKLVPSYTSVRKLSPRGKPGMEPEASRVCGRYSHESIFLGSGRESEFDPHIR